MGGRGALSTTLSSQLQEKYEKYSQESMKFQRKIDANLDDFECGRSKRLSAGYLEQLTQKREKSYIRSQSQLERTKLIHAETRRVETIRDSAKQNYQFFEGRLKNFEKSDGSVTRNYIKYQHYRSRYYYYRARYEASVSELKARQLRNNIRNKKNRTSEL